MEQSKIEQPEWTETTVNQPGLADNGLVWWRPDGVISETPELDKALVKG